MTPGEGSHASNEIDLAEKALEESDLLARARLPGAVSRLYYAVFHAARAALAVRGLKARTHSGQAFLYEQTFGPAPLLGRLLDLRSRADYGEEPLEVSQEELRARLTDAGAFVAACRLKVEEALAKGPDRPDPPPDF